MQHQKVQTAFSLHVSSLGQVGCALTTAATAMGGHVALSEISSGALESRQLQINICQLSVGRVIGLNRKSWVGTGVALRGAGRGAKSAFAEGASHLCHASHFCPTTR